ncbi:hypothetical protein BOTBODRAFT_623873 [Botryobasidium botryosum FD-172 SS1]|uniref:Cytochrome c oxidase subunit 4, mitochondrial n=1 Tax=Botryobasidium botryosum (strain FD-172 SS1) TaxID=930990 RepID=A0A067MMB9_BOTB1|nr:hypothetical protein BOTBODRAFT_623873 [Botryobasidium botryosum FD-172 SS1]
MLRLLRPARALARCQPRPAAAIAARPFSSTLRARSDHHAAPPQLLGDGASAGTVPTDENQATGLERLQILGNLEGIDVFDMKPLEMTRLGTVDEPIKIHSWFPERVIGCTGFPADSHDTLWLNLTSKRNARCPECGSGTLIFLTSSLLYPNIQSPFPL